MSSLRALIRMCALSLFATVLACASGQPRVSANDTPQRQATIFSGPEVMTVLADRPRSSSRTIGVQPAKVWAMVKQTYADYGVPLTVDNAASHQLGNGDFYRTRTFVGRPMTELVSCGSGMTGPNAASYRIYMSLLTTVDGRGNDSATVSVTLTASARDMAGGVSSDRLPCGSTGELERLFLVRVNTLVGPK